MNDVTTFRFNGATVRTLVIAGEPWWMLRDVCDVLGLSNSRMVAERLDADEKGVSQMDTLGGPQDTTIVNESGLYAVILRSDKHDARAFRKWITSEVVPTIRKTGHYGTEAPTGPRLLALAVLEAQRMIEEKDAAISALAPRAAVADRIEGAVGLKTLAEVGKINGIGPRRIIDLLLAHGILYRRGRSILPSQEHIEAGRLVVRERTFTINEQEHLYSQTFVTGKGEVWLVRQFFPFVGYLKAAAVAARGGE
jgi:anti-repressor protein